MVKVLDFLQYLYRKLCRVHSGQIGCVRLSVQVWYRVIQIVINRDDVQGYAAKTVFEVGSSSVSVLIY